MWFTISRAILLFLNAWRTYSEIKMSSRSLFCTRFLVISVWSEEFVHNLARFLNLSQCDGALNSLQTHRKMMGQLWGFKYNPRIFNVQKNTHTTSDSLRVNLTWPTSYFVNVSESSLFGRLSRNRRFLLVTHLMACAGSDGALMILSSH